MINVVSHPRSAPPYPPAPYTHAILQETRLDWSVFPGSFAFPPSFLPHRKDKDLLAMCYTSGRGPQFSNSAYSWSTTGLKRCSFRSRRPTTPFLPRRSLIKCGGRRKSMLLYVMISRLLICLCLQGHVCITGVEQREPAVKIFTVQKDTQAPTP